MMTDTALTITPEMQQSRKANIASLLASDAALLFSALPSAMIASGKAENLSRLLESLPLMSWFVDYKAWVLGIAALLLIYAGILQRKARAIALPKDPQQAAACIKIRKQNGTFYEISAFTFGLSVLVGLVAPFFM